MLTGPFLVACCLHPLRLTPTGERAGTRKGARPVVEREVGIGDRCQLSVRNKVRERDGAVSARPDRIPAAPGTTPRGHRARGCRAAGRPTGEIYRTASTRQSGVSRRQSHVGCRCRSKDAGHRYRSDKPLVLRGGEQFLPASSLPGSLISHSPGVIRAASPHHYPCTRRARTRRRPSDLILSKARAVPLASLDM